MIAILFYFQGYIHFLTLCIMYVSHTMLSYVIWKWLKYQTKMYVPFLRTACKSEHYTNTCSTKYIRPSLETHWFGSNVFMAKHPRNERYYGFLLCYIWPYLEYWSLHHWDLCECWRVCTYQIYTMIPKMGELVFVYSRFHAGNLGFRSCQVCLWLSWFRFSTVFCQSYRQLLLVWIPISLESLVSTGGRYFTECWWRFPNQ